MLIDGRFLWQVLKEPSLLKDLNGEALSDLIRLAWRQALAPRLGVVAQQAGVLGDLVPLAAQTLADLAITGETSWRRLQFEMERIDAALRAADFPVLLLKGGAYQAGDFSFSHGRLASDVDILVPKESLDACEQLLKEAGWEMEVKSAYAERYYRQWMHELPPLRHTKRKSLIDVHHTIVPPVARITPSPEAIFDCAVETSFETLKRPSHADLFVHAALHCFYDGDFTAALRSFLDLRDLIAALPDQQDRGLDRILERASVHEAKRPVADALYLLVKVDDLELTSKQATFVVQHSRPAALQSFFFWAIAQRSFSTQPFRYRDPWLAHFALYARSHWITMPPLMLARHTIARLYQSARGQV
ncbi:MAG: nucleotidyltransferase family protein [Pseudomonadota bacterium]